MNDLTKYEPERALSATDKILLRGASAGKSPKEISDLTGGVVKPAVAAARILAILDSRDWLSQAHRKMLLTDDLMALKDALFQRVVELKDFQHATALKSTLELINKTLEADKLDLAKAMSEISRAHASLMLSAISLALERSFLELERRYPEVQKSELTEIFQLAMPDVVREVEGRVPAE